MGLLREESAETCTIVVSHRSACFFDVVRLCHGDCARAAPQRFLVCSCAVARLQRVDWPLQCAARCYFTPTLSALGPCRAEPSGTRYVRADVQTAEVLGAGCLVR